MYKIMWKCGLTFLLVINSFISQAASILIPMDESQKNHLKAYGIVYKTLTLNVEADWLLNYRGGSFLIKWKPRL